MSICGIIFGGQGVGKTTAIARMTAKSGMRWKWLLTNSHSCDRAIAEGLALDIDPKWILSEYAPGKVDDVGMPVRAPTLKRVRKLLLGLEAKKAAGALEIDGIVISEGSTLLEWIYNDVRASVGAMQSSGVIAFGGRDRFDISAVLRDFCNWLASFSSRNGIGIILDSHRRERTFFEEGPKAGELKYPAGPSAPEGNAMIDLCKPFQFVWEIVGEGDPQEETFVLTRPGESSIRKTKGVAIEPREALTDDDGLLEKFVRAGWLTAPATESQPTTKKRKTRA